jgi:hypothetical protein
MRRAQDNGVYLVRQIDIVAEAAASGEQTQILLARYRAAYSLG